MRIIDPRKERTLHVSQVTKMRDALSYYARHRERILAQRAQERRERGVPVGRGLNGKGRAGRKPKPPLGVFTCANPACGIRKALTRNNPTQAFCSRSCKAVTHASRPRGGVRHTKRSCATCSAPFAPRYLAQRSCSVECAGKQRRNPAKSQALRDRRQRASRARRLRGGRAIVGRWLRIYERDDWVCWLCKGAIDRSLVAPHSLAGTADHVVPLSRGGSDEDANLRAAHFGCNSRRGASEAYTPHNHPASGGSGPRLGQKTLCTGWGFPAGTRTSEAH